MKLGLCGVLMVMAGTAFGQGAAAPVASPATNPHSVPFPHPLITEVLFNVPSGARGDANGDGTRDAVGDEFVELINPHDKPIQLQGYVLTDSAGWPGPVTPNPEAKDAPDATEPTSTPDENPPKAPAAPNAHPSKNASKPHAPKKPAADKPGEARRGAVKFVFPALTLQPGERVVVFNGYKQKFAGPVGSKAGAPAAKDPNLGDAYIFSMHNDSKFNSFGNTGDWVGLASPTGETVETLVWGTPKTLPPKAILSEEAPVGAGSVQRASPQGEFVHHQDLPGADGGKMSSPGVFGPGPAPASAPAAAPGKK